MNEMPDILGRWGGHSLDPPEKCEYVFMIKNYRLVDNVVCKYICDQEECPFKLKRTHKIAIERRRYPSPPQE